ncbi:alpha/beta fold hydrolase [Actinokineospora sp. NBRC 105648]|uniref:alpha/beta fold hydrolase n=1 Tax=Actinokineospora sp. NBRC 105648 TaxID=3032206 RepID=UPI0024A18F44|nr:alpha/beta fold hydrolase [Actinokineospora sp. NBRC 105648]GLZ36874.1 alpha/beta hydrolase [Actinokineospora sp. NBRC 105648]
MRTTDHLFTVPLDHADPGGAQIEVYAREVGDPSLPWLLFLNGGPGFASPRPLGDEGWLHTALRRYRVLLLDQRGTGRSTPVTRRSLGAVGEPAAQAEYLTHFRADSIVRDAERIRRTLGDGVPWSVLGQSFGGFCILAYLSTAPEGLREAFVTGGLPGLGVTADDVYRSLYTTVAAKNSAHYERFPADVDRAAAIAQHLRANDVRLPNGRRLTVPVFQSLGNLLGAATGSARLHYLLEAPFDGAELSDAFLWGVDREVSWAAASPLYAVLHEPTYADGDGALNWSAQRLRAEFPEFDAAEPLLFTGEMIFPWTYDDPALESFRAAGRLLAERAGWSRLYDLDRLRANEVPVTAAVYENDMYVARDLSLATADLIGARVWRTAEYEHDGLRVSGGAVLDELFTLAAGPAPAGRTPAAAPPAE